MLLCGNDSPDFDFEVTHSGNALTLAQQVMLRDHFLHRYFADLGRGQVVMCM
jgi:hypothetical protein